MLFQRDPTSPHQRRQLAAAIGHLATEARRDPRGPRAFRALRDRRVVEAAYPDLARIRQSLLAADVAVSPIAMTLLRDFLTQGADSPLFGRDPAAARTGARELAVGFGWYAERVERRREPARA
jgi:hypothetical protein